MCMICDGHSPGQLLHRQVDNIKTHGFTLLSITGAVPWTYSIGLRWSLNVPEFIVVGWPAEQAAAVLYDLVDAVRQGNIDIRCGSEVAIGKGSVGFGPVASENLVSEWFAQWHEAARASGHGHQSLRALQAQPSCATDCGEPHGFLDHALTRKTTPDRIARERLRRIVADSP